MVPSCLWQSETERKQKELEDCKKARDDAQILYSKLEDEDLEYRKQVNQNPSTDGERLFQLAAKFQENIWDEITN